VYAEGLAGRLEHWTIDLGAMADVVDRVLRVTAEAYADPRAIPYHSRWRHFGAGGVDRVAQLDARLESATEDERLASRMDLVITSVLLDAGAGERWAYRDAQGRTFTRSEGLAVASHDVFVSGTFSASPATEPLRADGEALARTDARVLAAGFQVDAGNPLVGLEGRAALLRRLGERVEDAPSYFAGLDGRSPARLGHIGVRLRQSAHDGAIAASVVLDAVLDALGPIWARPDAAVGQPPGDVWAHSRLGSVPFHKLSQWLAYSLCEPLEWSGLRVTGLAELTGLAEYRNGGLFVDGGVLVPVRGEALREVHAVGSDFVIEWRALTVALLDRVAQAVRERLGLSDDEMPLARVLEGGTWRAGRAIAAERRPGGAPPLRIASDGTVF
jgi:hypothetical protein